jgi:hypothetical protein
MPAERARGLIDIFDLTSPQEILQRGGVITGLLQYDSVRGAYFGGASYCTFPVRSQLFAGFGWSAVIEFTPGFEANDGAEHVIFDTSATNRTVVRKNSDNSINMICGGTILFAFALATYQAYWRTGQRNVLTFSVRSGGQTVILNGVQFGTAGIAYTAALIPSLSIGANYAGGSKFLGSIHSIKFFKHNSSGELLSAAEAENYYSRSTFTYRNKATCILPMGAAQHDATNLKTLDASPNGQHFSWTAGATAPTKLATVGYSADGGDTFSNATVVANSTYTVALVMKHSSATGYMADWRGGGGTGYIRLGSAVLLQVSSGTAYVNGKASTVLAPGSFNIIMVTGVTINGPAGTKLLADNAGATGITGSIHGYAVWPGTLTPLQVRDYTMILAAGINRV